ncbi:MAG: hypothetical protein N2422_10745 [Rhodobacteraceae bacterium]|nr:hypothetical protein [Paracoccaceae bacterium]
MRTCLAAALVAAALAGPAAARAPFAGGEGCYWRSYGAAHLAAHPAQQVTTMRLEAWSDPAAAGRQVLRLTVTVRGGAERPAATAYCEATGGGVLACDLEGDAGSFAAGPAPGGAVRLRVGDDGLVFEGARGFVELSGRAGDDRVFLLRPGCP